MLAKLRGLAYGVAFVLSFGGAYLAGEVIGQRQAAGDLVAAYEQADRVHSESIQLQALLAQAREGARDREAELAGELRVVRVAAQAREQELEDDLASVRDELEATTNTLMQAQSEPTCVPAEVYLWDESGNMLRQYYQFCAQGVDLVPDPGRELEKPDGGVN